MFCYGMNLICYVIAHMRKYKALEVQECVFLGDDECLASVLFKPLAGYSYIARRSGQYLHLGS